VQRTATFGYPQITQIKPINNPQITQISADYSGYAGKTSKTVYPQNTPVTYTGATGQEQIDAD
jgi:hypothetical protein